MICPPCARAADQRLGRDQHCDDEKCMCGHKVEKYGKTTGYDVVVGFYNNLARVVDQTTEVHPRAAVGPIGEPVHIIPADYLADPIINLGPLIAGYEEALAEGGCTATLARSFGAEPNRCAQPAGHYDDTVEPVFGADGWATDVGGWHAIADKRCTWSDRADGATPHADTTTED